jgi:iron complex outermembrane receptor protein
MYIRSTPVFVLLFILLFTQSVWSQSPADSPSDPTRKTLVKGVLTEESTGEPLPFANAVAYFSADSSLSASALTEENGFFSMKLSPGNYYMVFTFIGFQDKVFPGVNIEGGQKVLDLGRIAMRSDAIALEEVEVREERSQMEFKLDRRVFNVGKDLTSAGNSAADILDNVPSVNVDTEGNVSLRGSQGVRILIDGKPSGLLSAGETDALLRMQGDIIESVEVITNPSARYEAEGEAGIINIILKKNRKKGVNGSFGATLGYPQNFGASYSLNYRRSDFNFFSNFGIDYRRAPGGGNSTQQFFDNGELTDFFTTDTDQSRGGLGGYFQFGTDWQINERDMLTGSLLYRAGEDDNEATVIYRDFDGNRKLLNTTSRDVEEVEAEHNLEAALNFTRSFKKEDHKWTIDIKYILDDDTEIADYVQTSSDVPGELLQKSSNTEDEINFLFQTDYIYPIGEKSKVEGGLRATLRTVNNDFRVEERENNEFVTLSDFDDRLKYTEDIYAAYVIGAHEFGPFGLQAGVRAELSDITAELLRSGQRNDQDYLSLFPSASLSYNVTEKDQLQLSYSRRLSRPYFRRLLPFSNFNNPRNNSIGNPNLRPEFSNAFEAGYLRYFKNGTLLSSLYYRRTTGVIERIILPADDGTAIRYPVNLSVRNSYGLEFNFSYDLTPWWNLNADANFFRALIDGEFEGVDYSADTYAWSGQINTRISIGERLDIQPSFDYDAPQRTTQGRRLAIYNFDIGASLDILDGKGTLTLTGRDLFNTRKRRTEIDQPNYQLESVFQWRQRRQVVLTFNYRLNKEKEERSEKRGMEG